MTDKFHTDQSEISTKPIRDLKDFFSYVGMFGGILGFNITVYSFTNPFHNKVYIGQTNNLLNRMLTHKADLNRGNHRNKELQNDYNELKLKFINDDPINKFESSIIYNKVINFEVNLQVVIDEVLKSLEIEAIEIARAIQQGKRIYNLGSLAGKASIVENKFYFSLTRVCEVFNINVDEATLRFEDNINYPDWNYVPNTSSVVQVARSTQITFIDPIKNITKDFISLREAGTYLQDFYRRELTSNKELLNKYRSFGICFSRREVSKICKQNNNPYLYFTKNKN